MKTTKWLMLVLMLAVTTLLVLRRASDDEGGPLPATADSESALESESANAPADSAKKPFGRSRRTIFSPVSTNQEDELLHGNRLTVIVQDQSGQPLEGTSVRTAFRGDGRRSVLTNLNRTFYTNPEGVADVLWPTQSFAQFELLASKEQYAPRKMVWDLSAGDKVPASYTVKLNAGVQLGGIVVDPEGNPIAEATVRVYRFLRGAETLRRQGEDSGFSWRTLVTGVDGRWRAEGLPGELMERIAVDAKHSNYIGVALSIEGKPEVERELRAGTYQIRLRRGLEARGRIVNEQQQPIAGAQVWAGRILTRERQSTATDEQGRFAFRNVKQGKLDVSASAVGYAPATKTSNISTGAIEEIVLQLAKGSTIRGIVQDETGQPIDKVRVALEGNPGDLSNDRFEFSTTTDSAGRFEWASAPAHSMSFYFSKLSYQQKRGVRLVPEQENVVTLRANRQIHGQVVDAASSQPVTRFNVAVGRQPLREQFYPNSDGARNFNNAEGLFTVEIREENENAIRVTADGYEEQMEQIPSNRDSESKLVVKIKPSLILTGIVVSATGQPVEGATIALLVGTRSVQLSQGKLRPTTTGSRTKLFTSDASGQFVIVSPPEAATLVASHSSGYGSATVAELKSSRALVLQGFGRIEGVLLQAGGPATGQEVLLHSTGNGVLFDFLRTMQMTDAQGRFAFEGVPAGSVILVRVVKTSDLSWTHSHRTEVLVKPGETTRVVMGGTDATLHASVRFETAPAETDFIMRAHLRAPLPEIPSGLSAEDRQAFVRSPDYLEALRRQNYYSAIVRADGSLMLDSIPPGQYTLRVTAEKRDNGSLAARPLASGEIPVTVPAGANPGTPFNVGDVVLKPLK